MSLGTTMSSPSCLLAQAKNRHPAPSSCPHREDWTEHLRRIAVRRTRRARYKDGGRLAMAIGGVWIPVTLLASSAQTLRNAMQRDLIGALGAVGAAQVRFLFGLPFALMFLAGLTAVTGLSAPRLTAVNFAWTVFGAVSQVIATALMLAAMRTKSFVVAIAYTKTEAAQIALFGLIALNDPPTPALVTAIALATIGVALMAIRSRKELMADWRSAALGLFSATFF